MNICFVAAGPIEWGSSRMRAYWVAEELKKRGHEVWCIPYDEAIKQPELLEGCDPSYIWQKVANTDVIELLTGKHYWDVCDPSWWWQPDECREIADLMDGVVASSERLAEDFNQWYGKETAVCIPDRLNLDHFPKQRQHQDVNPVRFIWFGVAVNRVALYGVLASMERLAANGHNIELTIMDDRPDVPLRITDKFPIYHVRWELDKENEILASHDIAVLPPYPGHWGLVKSNNKTLTAWASGLPVIGDDFTYYEIVDFVTNPKTRQSNGFGNGWEELIDEWQIDVKQSAIEWELLLCN